MPLNQLCVLSVELGTQNYNADNLDAFFKTYAPDQVGSNAMPTPHTHTRGTPAQYDSSGQPTNTLMVPSDVTDGSYPVEPGAEYFGDFAFDGMDDILFGFNASESIFQDFM